MLFKMVELNDLSSRIVGKNCDGGAYGFGRVFTLQDNGEYLVEYWNDGSCGFDYCHKTGNWGDCFSCIFYNRETGECEFAGEFVSPEKLREEINKFSSRPDCIVEVDGDTLRLTIPPEDEEE